MKKLLLLLLIQINLYSLDYYISLEKSENSLSIYNEDKENETSVEIAQMRDTSSMPISIGTRSEKEYWVGSNWGIGYFIESGFSIFDINKQVINVDEVSYDETKNYNTSINGFNAHLTPIMFFSIPFPFIIPLSPTAGVPLGTSLIFGIGLGLGYTYAEGEYLITKQSDPSYNQRKAVDESDWGANAVIMLELPIGLAKDNFAALGAKISVTAAGKDEEGTYSYNHSYTSYYLKIFF